MIFFILNISAFLAARGEVTGKLFFPLFCGALAVIAAVVVGGTSMAGGKGSIIGTVLGMLIIAVMNNLLNLMGVPPFLREAFKGFIVIAAVLLQKKEAAN